MLTRVKPDFREIPLAFTNHRTIVDEIDYDYLMQWEWTSVTSANRKLLAVRYCHKKGNSYYLHKEIVNLYCDDAKYVTHLNGDTLDNRRSNLKPKIHKKRVSQNEAIAKTSGLLTEREKEIASLASTGLSNPQIAQQLHIKIPTVAAHLYNAFRKLGIANRTELVLALDIYNSLNVYTPLPIPKGRLGQIDKLKSQRLMAAQILVSSINEIALLYMEYHLPQLQQIQSSLDGALKVLNLKEGIGSRE